MHDLASQCRKIESFTHVSTAYVNSNTPDKTRVEEKVYPLGDKDPEDAIQQIIDMGPQRVAEQEQSIIGAYPNTYTFSKSYAERTLQKRSG